MGSKKLRSLMDIVLRNGVCEAGLSPERDWVSLRTNALRKGMNLNESIFDASGWEVI